MSLLTLQNHPLVQTLASMFEDRPGAEVFLVGGAVRNALLEQPFKDIDVVVRGLAVDGLEEHLRRFGNVDLVGRRFAVLKLRLADGTAVDVALPRTDKSFMTGRYRDVDVQADPWLPIDRDLERRDFTINAMAWDVKRGRLVDPNGGERDLAKHLVRCVGEPSERFQEDATRMLRAIRFAVQLDFSIEETTAKVMEEKLTLLTNAEVTPREVVAEEFARTFADDPVRALDLWEKHGVVRTLLPELGAMRNCEQPEEFHAEGDVWTHTRLALEALADPSFQATFHVKPSIQLITVLLLHDVGKPPTQKTPERNGTDRIRFDGHAHAGVKIAVDICERLKLGSAGVDCGELAWLIEHHLDVLNVERMRPTTLEKTYLLPRERGFLLQRLSWADARASLEPDEVRRGEKFHEVKRFKRLQERLRELQKRGYHRYRIAPLLNGNEVMRLLNIPSGPRVGEVLERLRDAQLDGRVTTKDEATAFIRQPYGT